MLISRVREKLFVDSGIYANLKTYYNLYFHKNPYIQYTVYTHIQLIYTILLYYHNLSLRPRNIYIYTFYLKNRSAYYQAPGTKIVFASRRLGIMSTLVPGYNIFKYNLERY